MFGWVGAILNVLRVFRYLGFYSSSHGDFGKSSDWRVSFPFPTLRLGFEATRSTPQLRHSPAFPTFTFSGRLVNLQLYCMVLGAWCLISDGDPFLDIHIHLSRSIRNASWSPLGKEFNENESSATSRFLQRFGAFSPSSRVQSVQNITLLLSHPTEIDTPVSPKSRVQSPDPAGGFPKMQVAARLWRLLMRCGVSPACLPSTLKSRLSFDPIPGKGGRSLRLFPHL